MKILYYMHVPWGWIKQRPHFIAEGLSKTESIEVIYEKPFQIHSHQTTESSINTNQVFRLPFDRYNVINSINNILIGYQIKQKLKGVDALWITDPRLFNRVPSNCLSHVKLIYDCMDDILEFPQIKQSNRYESIRNCEEELVKKSSIIFTSAKTLKTRLISRYQIEDESKIHLVNNALDPAALKEHDDFKLSKAYEKIKKAQDQGKTVVTYVGTISNWFDLELITNSLETNASIHVFLFGPLEIDLPSTLRLTHLGILEHKMVFSALKHSDILIMPFQINKLIEGVDPVKIYEYIASGTNSVIPKYSETNKFSEFVELYTTQNEFDELLQKTQTKINQNNDLFVKENSWSSRISQILSSIKLITQEILK